MNDIISAAGDDGFVIEIGQVYEKLSTLSDGRQSKGKRYPLAAVLMFMLLAKLAGQDRPYGMAQWVALRGRQLAAY